MSGVTIAVAGGTGALGQPVVRKLLEEGYQVQLLVRNEETARRIWGSQVSYVVGDVESDDAVRRAVAGASSVHVSLSGGADPASLERIEYGGTARIARLAREEGVRRITYLSGMYVDHPAAASWADKGKEGAEEAIRASGVSYTIFKPTYFMDTLPRQLRGNRAVVLGSQPHALHMVAATDFAAMVARAFAGGPEVDGSFHVQGPEALTMCEALGIYCELLAPGTRVTTMPLFVMRAINRVFMGGRLRRELEIVRLLNGIGEVGDPGPAHLVFGKPRVTLRAWCLARRDEQRRIAEQRYSPI